MKIYTSYFAKLNKIKDKGYHPISIARFTPNGVLVDEFKSAAPSLNLLDKIKSGLITNDEYENIYRKEIDFRLDMNNVLEAFNKISSMNDGKDIVLLCYEKPNDFCHRHIFAKIFNEKTGIKIKELNI